ncbi:TIGR03619 family F420-dependent LLM class oxidoreductase [Amycolatopsis pithecellobii]|uniref:LLM class flavin-dependent oxidoreductase n=1 Tax=Amycolatopsis pithecellobii TaxID=664692 RepID=A0A6N7Z0D2_9PSEU|nr:TIGR03619 family F420-dependent LLM class oxidoreductase [Amycolatopsis pithecellobii]MTD54733.1 LLM class flavin-dependent oxidoreductase [Amycolatopsis pithecellobii]
MTDADRPHIGLILALTIRGLSVGNYPDMARVARVAESHGFDSVWLCDHFLTLSPDDYVRDAGITGGAEAGASAEGPSSIPLLECWTALSALSRDTRTLRLGTSVLCNSYRFPAVLAKMAATLDVISEGRVDLGLGAGWFQQEFEAYGIPFPSTGDRVSALAESLQVLRSVWTEPNPEFHGKFYEINGAICDPPPVQQPHPPLWVGGEGLRVGRIAVRYANGINVRWWPAGKCGERRALLDRECEAIGRDPATLQLSLTTLLAPTESPAAQQQLRARFKSIPESGLITGSPEACLARIREYQDQGINHFLFTVPDVAESDHLDVVGEQILPHLDRRSA